MTAERVIAATRLRPGSADDRWHWSTGDSFPLTADPHTVHIWQLEAGARVNALALTTSATPPP